MRPYLVALAMFAVGLSATLPNSALARHRPTNSEPTTRSHICHRVAHNERMEATNLPCWKANEYVLGARERFYNVNWHGQDFKLYGFWCKVVNEFKQPRSTWYFNCERGRKYANFTWTFEQ